MTRLRNAAWWGTITGLAALAAGIAVMGAYALSEVVAHPGLSLVDGYWIGRLPWTGIAEGLTVAGATGACVVGAVAVLSHGGLWRRLLVIAPIAAAAFFWFVAMLPPHYGAPCIDCPPQTPDPFAYAYSAPVNAVVFLFLPALAIAALALTGRRRQAPD